MQCSLILMVAAAVYGANANKYCDMSPQHTMCKYKGIGATCGKDVPAHGVPTVDQKTIIDEHNKLRAKVANGQQKPQPNAANMMELKWDGELAQVAQRHVEQCVFKHDCNACRKITRFSVGQNLQMAGSSRKSSQSEWPVAIKAWFDEVASLSASAVDKYSFSMSTGHYTQLVWADTTHIGCGFVVFKQGRWWQKMHGCNYGPAGNMVGAAIYKRGKPCSSCPGKCSTKNRGLCAQ